MSEALARLHVRRGEVGDAALLARLINAAFSPYKGRLKPESSALQETPEAVRTKLVDGHGSGIASFGPNLAGCVLFKQTGTNVYFGRLAVLADHRGRGVARALIEFVEAEARRAGALSVSLEVRVALPDNQRLFQAAGYREVARHAHPGFTEPTSIEMRKKLS